MMDFLNFWYQWLYTGFRDDPLQTTVVVILIVWCAGALSRVMRWGFRGFAGKE